MYKVLMPRDMFTSKHPLHPNAFLTCLVRQVAVLAHYSGPNEKSNRLHVLGDQRNHRQNPR